MGKLQGDFLDLTEMISEYVLRFSKQDKINLDWLKRVIFVNFNQSISDEDLINYLEKLGYKNHSKLKESFNKREIKSEDAYNTTVSVIDEDDLDDFDPNEFLEANEEKIRGTIVPTNNYEDNTWLIETYQTTGREDLFFEIVNKNMGLVEKNARKYMNNRHKLDLEDLISIGKFGLITAIEKFKPEKGYQFSTYATYWVRQKITRTIMDEGSTIRLPVHMHEQINSLLKIENESFLFHQKVDIDWVCEQLNISRQKYFELKKIDHQFLGLSSLHSVISTEDDDSLLIDFVEYDPENHLGAEMGDFFDPFELVQKKDLRYQLEKVLNTFPEREEMVIRLRFGLDTGVPKTLEEVGQLFGLTRERIRQIEAKTLPKIQKRLLLKNLDYENLKLEK